MDIKEWIYNKFSEVSERMETLVHSEPASFACGYNVGYRQCLIEIEKMICDMEVT
jgi:hypothetical protein